MSATHRLVAQLLYGTGMRISEALQLRVKDVDFERRTLIVRCGKGGKDRALMLPETLLSPLREQLASARLLWAADREAGLPGVQLPDALARKYPRAPCAWSWFWVFAQSELSRDPRSEVVRRHHLYDETFQRAFKRAVRARASRRRPRRTRCATRLPRTCCKPATTSAPCRSCSATPTSARR